MSTFFFPVMQPRRVTLNKNSNSKSVSGDASGWCKTPHLIRTMIDERVPRSMRWVRASQGATRWRICLWVQEMEVQFLSREGPLEKCMTPHSSILAWRTPWMEAPGGLPSMGSQWVGHDWANDGYVLSRKKKMYPYKHIYIFFLKNFFFLPNLWRHVWMIRNEC